MPSADDLGQARVISVLTRVGSMFWLAWLLTLFNYVFDAARVRESQIGGTWDQRIERLGFASLPPNLVVLALAAACAATATWMAGPTQELGLAVLLRIVRWSANLVAVFAVAWIVSSIVNDTEGPNLAGSIAFRLAGGLTAAGISVVCLEAGRTAPGG